MAAFCSPGTCECGSDGYGPPPELIACWGSLLADLEQKPTSRKGSLKRRCTYAFLSIKPFGHGCGAWRCCTLCVCCQCRFQILLLRKLRYFASQLLKLRCSRRPTPELCRPKKLKCKVWNAKVFASLGFRVEVSEFCWKRESFPSRIAHLPYIQQYWVSNIARTS